MTGTFIAYDLETTGISPTMDRILEIGAVHVVDFQMKEEFRTFVNPGRKIPEKIIELTGITDEMVKGAPSPEEAVKSFLDFCSEDTILGHNLIFDFSFIKVQTTFMKLPFEKKGLDTLKMARKLCPQLERKSLEYLCEYYQIESEHHHRAVDDAKAAAELYFKLCSEFPDAEEVFCPEVMEYRVKKQSPITERQLSYLTALVEKHRIKTDVELASLQKSEASRMIDRILSTYGRG